MKAGIIGAGKVGFSLGKYFREHGIPVTGYYSRDPASAREAAAFTQTHFYETAADIVRDSDTLFLTVPDGAIGKVWDDMGSLPVEGKNICHCSGSISSAVFFDAEERGAYRYSVHPLYAVSDKYTTWKELGRAMITLEGSPAHLQEMAAVFHGMGNRVTVLADAEKKTLYHAAAVMVSNQVAALASLGVELLMQCGFTGQDAEIALGPLLAGNAEKIAKVGPIEALTGPVERGDAETVRSHLAAMRDAAGMMAGMGDAADTAGMADMTAIREIYMALSRQLVYMAEKKHPGRDYTELKTILNKEDRKEDGK